MVILICEKVPESLRGELSRWMIEPKTNVFVGKMSAMVRDKLWARVQDKLKGGAAILAYPSNTEQGFVIKSCGGTTRQLVNYDGLTLVKIPARVVPVPETPISEIKKQLVEAGENPELW